MLKNVKDKALKLRNWLRDRHIAHIERTTSNYKDAKSVGVFWCLGEYYDADPVKRFVQQLKKDGKQVEMVCFTPDLPDASLGLDCTWVSYNHISLHGLIDHAELHAFLEKPFDFLYGISMGNDLGLLEWVMASSNALCRVGPHLEDKRHLFELMIHTGPEANTAELVEQMLHFTRGIKYNR